MIICFDVFDALGPCHHHKGCEALLLSQYLHISSSSPFVCNPCVRIKSVMARFEQVRVISRKACVQKEARRGNVRLWNEVLHDSCGGKEKMLVSNFYPIVSN